MPVTREWTTWMDNVAKMEDKVVNMLLSLYMDQDKLPLNTWEKGFINDNIKRLEQYTTRFMYTSKQADKIKDIYTENVSEEFDEALWDGMLEARRDIIRMSNDGSYRPNANAVPGKRTTLDQYDDLEDDIPF